MELSLIQAANLTGRSKSTIHRAIKSGKLSASRNVDSSYSISPAELFRVYPKEPLEAVPMRQSGTHEEPKEKTYEASEVYQMKIDFLTAQLEREKETVEDLRKRLDKAEDRILALTAPSAVPAATQATRSLWQRLLGK